MNGVVFLEKRNQRVVGHEDHYPENPFNNQDMLGIHTQLIGGYNQPHSEYDGRIIEAWERAVSILSWGRDGVAVRRIPHDTEFVERYARVCLDAVAVAWFESRNSNSRVFSYITREVAEREQLSDPQQYLDCELLEYGAYVEGDCWILDIQDKCEVVSSKKDLHTGEILESEVTRTTWQTVETIGGYYGYDNAKAAAEEHLS